MRTHIQNNTPITLYNADGKYTIAVFSTRALAAKYLFGEQKSVRAPAVNDALRNKRRIKNSLYPANVAVRFSNPDQVALLGQNDVFISDDTLLKFDRHLLKGWDSNRISMAREAPKMYKKPTTPNALGVKLID